MAYFISENGTLDKAAAKVSYRDTSQNREEAAMSGHLTHNWQGASGKTYRYYIYPRHPTITEGQVGNYIYTKRDSEGVWVPVYIGQGDLSIRAHEEHQQIGCINGKGTTHIHAHLNEKETDRLAEEDDLLAYYTQAYSPTGCNSKSRK